MDERETMTKLTDEAKKKAERYAMRANRPHNALAIETKAFRKGFLAGAQWKERQDHE